MVSDIIKIFEKIELLFKSGKENKRRLFKEFVEPIFLDLAIIHEDYFNSFNAIDQKLTDFYKEYTSWLEKEGTIKKYSLSDLSGSPDASLYTIARNVQTIILKSNKAFLDDMLKFLKKKQVAYASLRKKTISICEVMDKDEKTKRFPKSIRDFVQEVLKYFYPDFSTDRRSTFHTLLVGEIEEILDQVRQNNDPTNFSLNSFFNRFDVIKDDIKRGWSNVTVAYAKVKIECMK